MKNLITIILLIVLTSCFTGDYKDYIVTYSLKVTYTNGDIQLLTYTTNIHSVSEEQIKEYPPRLTDEHCIRVWIDYYKINYINITCDVRSFGYTEPTKIERL